MDETDAPAVARVFAACFDAPWSEPMLREEPGRRGALCLVASCDGEVVGYALLRAVLDEAELLSIGVSPAARGRGVGGRLIDGALRACGPLGVRSVHLEVRADNAAAVALYLRAGFVEVGERRGYYADGATARLMSWAAT